MPKEAKARVKINNLLQDAGWRFFDDENGKANILLESRTKVTEQKFDSFGENFENTRNGFVDFLLLDDRGLPLVVLEAKAEDINPLSAKEQARRYAKSENCRFVILSNGNLHYFWDLERGNPNIITAFPTPTAVKSSHIHKPDRKKLIDEPIGDDYIAVTQNPKYASDPAYLDENLREEFITTNELRFLRQYQLEAVESIKNAVREGKDRFLFEMATGTGKTLVSAAVVKLFLRTLNANKVLFLVDRLELETQAVNAFNLFLKNDYKTVKYKENRDEWSTAHIVVTTIQTLLYNNNYQKFFSPTDFDLVISDEAHRSIGGNSRAVFEYFFGYKLGLTATPKNYLKNYKASDGDDPREYERRLLRDTYETFGCEPGEPTFSYSLTDGVRDGYLVNPYVIDARTEISTQFLSEKGYSAMIITDDEEEEEHTYTGRDFEKKFFSEPTNRSFCKAFFTKAMNDPITGETGKTIVFTVSQNHAAKITQILNEMADELYPGKYNSDFAVQVTSHVQNAQQFTSNFRYNNLNGAGNFMPEYKTCKTRVCVTVGMMTTGYDCTDILNICMMRPIFSPTDFVQMKGRGTRKHDFTEQLTSKDLKSQYGEVEKEKFVLLDFFGNYDFFEEEYNYDDAIPLPKLSSGIDVNVTGEGPTGTSRREYENFNPDEIIAIKEKAINYAGMKIDRKLYEKFEDKVKSDEYIRENAEGGDWSKVIQYLKENILDKPGDKYTLEMLQKASGLDRKLYLREMIEKALGMIPKLKTKDELLEEEFNKFVTIKKPDDANSIMAIKGFFKAYAQDKQIREIIDKKEFAKLSGHAAFTLDDYKEVPEAWRNIVIEYVQNNISIDQFRV